MGVKRARVGPHANSIQSGAAMAMAIGVCVRLLCDCVLCTRCAGVYGCAGGGGGRPQGRWRRADASDAAKGARVKGWVSESVRRSRRRALGWPRHAPWERPA